MYSENQIFVGSYPPQAAAYVVDKEISGIWHYRKWASGIAECWGTYYTTSTHYSDPFGGFFCGYYGNVELPVSFVSAPSGTYTVKIGSGFAVPAMGIANTWDSNTNTISWYALGNGPTELNESNNKQSPNFIVFEI